MCVIVQFFRCSSNFLKNLLPITWNEGKVRNENFINSKELQLWWFFYLSYHLATISDCTYIMMTYGILPYSPQRTHKTTHAQARILGNRSNLWHTHTCTLIKVYFLFDSLTWSCINIYYIYVDIFKAKVYILNDF